VTRPVLLDSSFIIELEREAGLRLAGPARAVLASLRGRVLVVSIVTVAEVLEGTADEAATLESFQRFRIVGLHLAHARRCALLQRRSKQRLGENDAWLVATAQIIDADIVAADRAAFHRLGARYLRFR